MKHLRIGLVGTGFMGKTHLFAVRNLPFFCNPDALGCTAEVAAVASSSPASATAFAGAFGIPRACESFDDLVSDPEIDIIDICSPNPAHYAEAKAALAAGKHVLCEKPLGVTTVETDELAALAEQAYTEKGLVTATVFNNRHLAPVIRAKQLIDEGRLGRILSFDFAYRHNSCIDPDRRAGWKQNADFGGGTLADLGPHAIDLCHYLCGDIKSVIARSQIAFPTHLAPDGSPWKTNADEAFYIIADTRDGATGTLTLSKLTQGANDELTFSVWGERGALSFSLMEPNYLYFYDATAPGTPVGGTRGYTRIECVGRYPAPASTFPTPKAPVGWLRGHTMSMANFLTCVANSTPCTPSFSDGAYVQRILEAARESDRAHREVTLC